MGDPRRGRGLVLESPRGSGVGFGIPVGVEGALKNSKNMLTCKAGIPRKIQCLSFGAYSSWILYGEIACFLDSLISCSRSFKTDSLRSAWRLAALFTKGAIMHSSCNYKSNH